LTPQTKTLMGWARIAIELALVISFVFNIGEKNQQLKSNGAELTAMREAVQSIDRRLGRVEGYLEVKVAEVR
jgi:hypothetical protein